MRRLLSRVAVGMLVLCCVLFSAAHAEDGPGSSDKVISIGFSRTLFSEVNIGDAVASIEVWAETIAKSKGIPVEMKVTIFESSALLEQALLEDRVDLVGLLTPDYLEMSQKVRLDNLYATVVRDQIAEEYLIIVHKDSGWTDLSQLSGTTLNALSNGRCSLAIPWLESFMNLHGLPKTADHFDRIQYESKTRMVILPVFFGKADACLVTRNAFETMTELNPQVGRNLRVIAQSPAFLPAVFCLRAGFDSAYKPRIVEGLDELHTQPSGEQVLIVFRGQRLLRITEEDFKSARLLMDQSRNGD